MSNKTSHYSWLTIKIILVFLTIERHTTLFPCALNLIRNVKKKHEMSWDALNLIRNVEKKHEMSWDDTRINTIPRSCQIYFKSFHMIFGRNVYPTICEAFSAIPSGKSSSSASISFSIQARDLPWLVTVFSF